jgi:hypothetical protein
MPYMPNPAFCRPCVAQAVILLGLLASLAGCGGARTAAPAAPGTPDPPLQSAPAGAEALPTPPLAATGPPRLTSDGDHSYDSSDVVAFDQGGQSMDAGGGNFTVLPGGADKAAWAMYLLALGGDSRPAQLSVTATLVQPGGSEPLRWWLGVYNYSQAHWEWCYEDSAPPGPRTTAGTVQVDLNTVQRRSRYVNRGSGAGVDSYFVVLVEPSAHGGGAGLTLAPGSLYFRSTNDGDYLPTEPLPVGITAASADVGGEKLMLTLDAPGDADRIYLQRRERHGQTSSLRGASAADAPGGWVDLGFIPGTATSFTDPDDATGAPAPQLGIPYEYRACAASLDGTSVLSSGFSAPLPAAIAGNQPPVARLTLPAGVAANQPVTLDASTSTDSDGTIANYEWDFDGDGVFNESDNGENTAQGNAVVQAQYPSGALVYPVVRVIDNGGAGDTTSRTLTVHGWVLTPVADHGWNPSLQTVAGKPAIAYRHTGDHKVMLAVANNATGIGPAAWSTVEIAAGSDFDAGVALAVVSGNPAVAYWGPGSTSLNYVRANSPTGASAADWGPPAVVDTGTKTGYEPSLAVVDGNPAIAYYDVDGQALKYARASTAGGNASGDWHAVELNAVVSQQPSLAVVDGHPAISYYDGTNGDLCFARATTTTGSSAADWHILLLDDGDGPAGGTGHYSSLTLVDGNPAISYRDATTQFMHYIRSSSASGSSLGDWTTRITLTDALKSRNGYTSSLVVWNGAPLVCYTDTNFTPQLDRSTSPTGGAPGDWAEMTGLETSPIGLDYLVLAVINGRPAVAYQNSEDFSLRFAILL